MSAAAVYPEGPCRGWPEKPGWRCTRSRYHRGPCALKPRWWNLRDRLRGF